MQLFANPEFIRNCRAQLRPGRVLATLVTVELLSFTLGYSLRANDSGSGEWAKTLLVMSLSFQLLVLGLGGGLACGLSIHREKEQNTFDFQRVTRMTPMELAIGKLFGAPLYSYFITLCLMPAVLVGAAVAHTPPSFFLAALLILILGCVVLHALALLLSLFSPKGGTGVPGALFLLFLPLMMFTGTSENQASLAASGPWAGIAFISDGTWQTTTVADRNGALFTPSVWTDLIFGRPVHHIPVLFFLYATFLAWILLALVRNLKRDPVDFELYSPAQSVGLLCYVNLVTLAFYRAREWGPQQRYMVPAQRTTVFLFFLGMNLVLLFMLGMSLLHNREQSRRRVYERGGRKPDWSEAVWPGGHVLLAAVAVALIVVTRFELATELAGPLDKGMAIFQALFLLVALLRDLFYFQWMKLRRSRYPFVSAVVFLGVFYTCSGILLTSLSGLGGRKVFLLSALPIPWAVLGLEQQSWTEGGALWFAILVAQLGLCAVFVMLHYRKLAEMAPSAQPAPARAEAA
jgi:hypothetical protein